MTIKLNHARKSSWPASCDRINTPARGSLKTAVRRKIQQEKRQEDDGSLQAPVDVVLGEIAEIITKVSVLGNFYDKCPCRIYCQST